MPVMHLIAGPNGAGKSTLYRYLIQPRDPELVFINADAHEQQVLQHITHPVRRSQAARAWAEAQRNAHLASGRSFVTETVFSHPSKLDLMHRAKAASFEVVLYIVCIDEPLRLLQRVRQRVREGGHDVPPHKILERYPRTLAQLAQAIRLANLSMLFHGRDIEEGGPLLVASVAAGHTSRHVTQLPAWADTMLAQWR